MIGPAVHSCRFLLAAAQAAAISLAASAAFGSNFDSTPPAMLIDDPSRPMLIDGSVAAESGGAPVVGATVAVVFPVKPITWGTILPIPLDSSEFHNPCKTDSKGHFAAIWPLYYTPSLSYGLFDFVTVRAPGFASIVSTRNGFLNAGTILLPAGRRLHGKVVRPDGTPIAKAQIVGVLNLDRSDGDPMLLPAPVETDPDGNFLLADLSDRGRVRLRESAPGFQARSPLIDLGPNSQDELRLVLVPGQARLEGHLRFADGKPIAAGMIRVSARHENPRKRGRLAEPADELDGDDSTGLDSLPAYTAFTDIKGRFSFDQLTVGEWNLVASVPEVGYEMGSNPVLHPVEGRSLCLSETNPAEEIVVPSPVRFTVRFIDAKTRQPIAGVLVSPRNTPEVHPLAGGMVLPASDSSGAVEVTTIPTHSSWSIRYLPPDGYRSNDWGKLTEKSPLTVELRRSIGP